MSDTPTTRVGAGRQAALYARAPQPSERDRTTAAAQLAACRALAAELGYAVADEATLADDAPNTTASRPGFAALLRLLADGRAGAVIAYTLDRLAREESELRETLLKELRRRAIPLYVARVPAGYRYDPATGVLTHDDAAVAAANREPWRPPDHIVIPREDGD